MSRFFFTLLAILLAVSVAAEPLVVEGMQGLGDARHHLFASERQGRDYHILVSLPDSYSQSEERSYPVVYILDGGLLFPMLAPYGGYLAHGEEIPEVVLVGISYGTDDWREGNDRSRDYTARADDAPHWGGADAFQQFLSDELLPFVESGYRVRADRRIIFGQSIGGQFVLYTALTRPDLFWGHIASNPALHRNYDYFLHAPEVEYTGGSHLYVASGSDDNPGFRAPLLRWMQHWIGHPDKPWRLKCETLQGHGHFSAPPAAFRRGMNWLFGEVR